MDYRRGKRGWPKVVELIEALYIIGLPLACIFYPNDNEAVNELVQSLLISQIIWPLRMRFSPAVDYVVALTLDDLQSLSDNVAGSFCDAFEAAAEFARGSAFGENYFQWAFFHLAIAVLYAFDDLDEFLVPVSGIFLEDFREFDDLVPYGVILDVDEKKN